MTDPTDRDQTIKELKRALRARSGKTWSVRGGRGTSWGWITILASPARCDRFGSMGPDDAQELADLLGMGQAHHQGVLIPAGQHYRREYIDRANGRTPSVVGTPYWD